MKARQPKTRHGMKLNYYSDDGRKFTVKASYSERCPFFDFAMEENHAQTISVRLSKKTLARMERITGANGVWYAEHESKQWGN